MAFTRPTHSQDYPPNISARTHSTPKSDSNYTHSSMAPSVATTTQTFPTDGQPRKRRRSREPDWNNFYKHGLPKEIIVIDDTPEPEKPVAVPPTPASTAGTSSRTLRNGGTTGTTRILRNDATIANGKASVHDNTTTTTTATAAHVTKKRRKDDNARYDALYDRRVNGSHHLSLSGSTSTDRTTSANNTTTAATSLGSLSSNGQYDHDAQIGQKRKRTRQQLAQEAKRREIDVLGGDPISYRPPQKPIKKAGEVTVRQVNDVSIQYLMPPLAILFARRLALFYVCSISTGRVMRFSMHLITDMVSL